MAPKNPFAAQSSLEPIECVDPAGELVPLVFGKLACGACARDCGDVVAGVGEFAQAERDWGRRILAGRECGENRESLRGLIRWYAQGTGERDCGCGDAAEHVAAGEREGPGDRSAFAVPEDQHSMWVDFVLGDNAFGEA